MSLGTLIVLYNEQELIKRQRGDGGFLVFVYLSDFDLQIRIDPNLFPMLMIQFSSSTFKELSQKNEEADSRLTSRLSL